MRIAFVCEELYGGGAERFTVTIANYFSLKKEDTIFVITGEKKEGEYELSENVIRKCLLQKGQYLFLDAYQIHVMAKKSEFDVLIGIGVYANLCVSIANIFMKTKVIISERNAPKQDYLSWKTKILRKLLYWNADGYVFQSNGAKDFYSAKIQKKSIVIHNPVRKNLPIKSGVCNHEIVAIGRLKPQKNYPLLIRAFKEVHDKHPDYVLRIFGQGLEEEKLRSLVKELSIKDAVVFEGFCLNVHEKIVDSDIFVMSSDFEGMPNSLMEAMAMGFPVVCTDCPAGGPSELIENGKNGLLVPVGNERALAERINYLIENEKEKYVLAREAQLLQENHGEKKIFELWKQYIDFLLKGK